MIKCECQKDGRTDCEVNGTGETLINEYGRITECMYGAACKIVGKELAREMLMVVVNAACDIANGDYTSDVASEDDTSEE